MQNAIPFETLLALAVDLLAHCEARQRAARRLERATALLAQAARAAGGCDAVQVAQVREHLRVMREFVASEHMLLEEFDRALASGAAEL